MTESLRDSDFLDHMLEALRRIRAYVQECDEDRFFREPMLQDAVIRNIEILGEAANRLSPEFTASRSDIPWRDIAGMRNRLIHGYMQVNLRTVWMVVLRDLPVLEHQLEPLRRSLPDALS